MDNQQIIAIANSIGNLELVNDTYAVTSSTPGYDDLSISPAEVEIVEGTDSYNFTIAATGTLTLNISDDGTNMGTPIMGAKFARCDSEGNIYGNEITSDSNGNAVFNYVPFSAEENAPIIYYKQTASDGKHEFDNTLKNTTLATQNHTIEVLNPPASVRKFSLTDTNYTGLPITDGQIILS